MHKKMRKFQAMLSVWRNIVEMYKKKFITNYILLGCKEKKKNREFKMITCDQ